MERLPVGSITFLLVRYPDETGEKRRPAVVINKVSEFEYWLLEITSQSIPFPNGVVISPADFIWGALNKPSQVRTDRILTANESLLRQPEGQLKTEVVKELVSKINSLLPKF
jgi:mRNA interferase MazF